LDDAVEDAVAFGWHGQNNCLWVALSLLTFYQVDNAKDYHTDLGSERANYQYEKVRLRDREVCEFL
jgi:hypothetical protein